MKIGAVKFIIFVGVLTNFCAFCLCCLITDVTAYRGFAHNAVESSLVNTGAGKGHTFILGVSATKFTRVP
jgi:hypothetical protein